MNKFVFIIFVIGVFLRFIYFPENIYFGFDQARDAFESQNIYKNIDIKIIGPSTASENLFHGPLYWYLIGPFYLLGLGNPLLPSAFLLLLNALGVFLVFWVARLLFDEKVGTIAALLFAFSFEQTQYALYFGNPAPAILTIMLFYAGLALAIFKKNWIGLPIAALGIGLSIQFEFFLIYLIPVFIVFLFVFRKTIIPLLNVKKATVAIATFVLATGNFIIADLRFDFRTTKTLISILTSDSADTSPLLIISAYIKQLGRHVQDNLFYHVETAIFISILIVSIVIVVRKSVVSGKVLFLLLWIFSGILVYAFGIPKLYYFGIGISAGIIIIASYFIFLLWSRAKLLGFAVIGLVLLSNILLIMDQNPKGIINDIYVQEGMLLSHEIKAIDFIYERAEGRPIVVSALTMPLKINTTWAYLFSWYGQKKYGDFPYWAGEVALGYLGELPKWESQEEDYVAFSIIEPTRGVRQAFIDQFLDGQGQYGKVLEEVAFGDKPQTKLVVQKRGKKEKND